MKIRIIILQLLIFCSVSSHANCSTNSSEIVNLGDELGAFTEFSKKVSENRLTTFSSFADIEEEGFTFTASDESKGIEMALEVDGSIAILTLKSNDIQLERHSFNHHSLKVDRDGITTCTFETKIFKYDGKLMVNLGCGVLASIEIGNKYVSMHDVDGNTLENEDQMSAIVLLKK